MIVPSTRGTCARSDSRARGPGPDEGLIKYMLSLPLS